MKVKIENPSVLAKTIELISEIVTEVRIKVGEFGLSVSAMDPANVAMVGLRIPKSAFSEFVASQETLGINLDDLKKILKRASASSALILESGEGVLNIIIHDRIKRNFSLSLIEVEAEDIVFEDKVARMEFTSKVVLPSAEFIDAITDTAVVSDACTFIVTENTFVIEARGLNSARVEFSADDAQISAEPSKSRYSLEYLQKFMKGAKLADKTMLTFAQDHPLRLDFHSPGAEISFILAPRVETED